MSQNLYPGNPVLLVDDESHALASFDIALRSAGLNHIVRCQDSREVMSLLLEQRVELILLDLIMPHVSGQEILSRVTEEFPDIPVIILTGVNEVDTAVQCLKKGAFDYILKPVEMDRLLASVRRALEMSQLRRENSLLSDGFFAKKLTHPDDFAEILTRNQDMQAMFKYCEAIAEGQHPVLITGETGVGKELVARALHRSSRRQGQCVGVNIAGLDDHVFADTLFGHVKGAYTGAERERTGLVVQAEGGTLFLDEIGDLSSSSQVKLLRFLEEREYYPLGSDVAKSTNTRVLVATHKDVRELKESGVFRNDLFYRLSTHHVHIPPLRERTDDIPLLLDSFLTEAAQEFGKKKPAVHRDLVTLLKGYHFPGNIREFKSMVFNAVGSHESRMLSSASFGSYISEGRLPTGPGDRRAGNKMESFESWAQQLKRLPTLKEATGILVTEALTRSENNQRVAARMLGISPQALNQRLKKKGEGNR
ncbi:sigma-54-dependent transcriptional regulator [Thermodesulfobacteriota bacterium]